MSNIAIDSKGKVNTNSVNVRKNAGTSYDRVEPANINDITPLPKILDEIENRLGTLPICIGLDAGYHNAATAHLPESRGIQAVIGYRRHTHAGEHFGKWCFRYDSYFDVYLCPKHQPLYWKTTTRQGTVNISAIQRQARSVLKEMTALANQQQEGWWSGMPGRTHRTKQHTLRKRRSANNSTNSAKRPLSDPSRRPKKPWHTLCTYAWSTKHARAVLPQRCRSEHQAPCQGLLVSFLFRTSKAVPPCWRYGLC